MALFAEQVPEDHRIGAVVLRVANLLVARLDPGLRLALFGHAGKIALHVGAEHRHALMGEAFREALQGDGLAGSRGASYEAMAIGKAEIDELWLDAFSD